MSDNEVTPPPPEETDAVPPPPPVAPAPQPAYGYQAPPKKKSGPMPSNSLMAILVMVGLGLVLLGALMTNLAPLETSYDHNGPAGNTPAKQADSQADDAHTQTILNQFGQTLNAIGMIMVIVVLLLAALLRTDLSDNVRFGLLFAVGLIMLGTGNVL